jgi:PTH1 family peptidyl-tRNA hydrolase
VARPGIVLGLGNPGVRYRPTRHNIGFRVVDSIARAAQLEFRAEGELGRRAWTAEAAGPVGPLVLAKPRTFMNRSGRAARDLCRFYEVAPDRLLVVYDDADLELGRIRLRSSGRAGGHRGVESVIEALGSDAFPRVRLGVRGSDREVEALEDYVLSPFEPEEEEIVTSLVELAVAAVGSILTEEMDVAMNRFNGQRA